MGHTCFNLHALSALRDLSSPVASASKAVVASVFPVEAPPPPPSFSPSRLPDPCELFKDAGLGWDVVVVAASEPFDASESSILFIGDSLLGEAFFTFATFFESF